MQSHPRNKAAKKPEPLSLPWGFGSMSWHGKFWWLTFRDPENNVVWKNSNTPDAVEAQKILAELALPRARKLLETLERIANGQETYRGESAPKRKPPKPRPLRRDSRRTTAYPVKGTSPKAPSRGEA